MAEKDAPPVVVGETKPAPQPGDRARGRSTLFACPPATIERQKNGVVISCPPMGFFGGPNAVLFPVAVLWCVFPLGLWAFLRFVPGLYPENAAQWLKQYGWYFFIPLLLVGLGLLLSAVRMAFAKTTLAVKNKQLIVTRGTMLGSKGRQWDVDEIEQITLGVFGSPHQSSNYLELRIYPRSGPRLGLLAEREDDELNRMASELNRALGLPEQTERGATRDESGQLKFPKGSRMAVRREDLGWRIEIPTRFMKHHFSRMFLGSVIVVFFAYLAGAFWLLGSSDGSFSLRDVPYPAWGAPLFMVVGLVLVGRGLASGLSSYEILVLPEELRVRRKRPWGWHTWNWPKEEVRSIRVVESGPAMSHVSLQEVQIESTDGKKLKLLTDWSIDELTFTAELLREMLSLEDRSYGAE